MSTKEIPSDDWGAFFQGLASSHRAWLTTIQITSFELGAQTWVEKLPLEDIGVEKDGEGNTRIVMSIGGADEKTAMHIIRSPRNVWWKTIEEGAEEVVEIVGRGGTLTLLRFQTAFRPQLAEGVTASQI